MANRATFLSWVFDIVIYIICKDFPGHRFARIPPSWFIWIVQVNVTPEDWGLVRIEKNFAHRLTVKVLNTIKISGKVFFETGRLGTGNNMIIFLRLYLHFELSGKIKPRFFFSHMAISIQNHLRFSNCRTDVRRKSHGDMWLRLRNPLFWQVLMCSSCIIVSLRVTFDLFILLFVNQSYRPCGAATWQADKLFILWRSRRRTKPRTIIIPDGPSARPIIDFPRGWTECEANNWLSKWMDRVRSQ